MVTTYTIQPTTSETDQNAVIPTDNDIGITASNQDWELYSLSKLNNNRNNLNPFLQNVLDGNVQAVKNNELANNLMSKSEGDEFNALIIAVFNKDRDMVEALVANAIHLLNNDVVPVSNGNPDRSKISASFKAFIDLVDSKGFTAFALGCLLISDDTVEKVIDNDDNSQTTSNVSIWFTLSNLYPDKYIQDFDGKYPLMNMILHGRLNLLDNIIRVHKLVHDDIIMDKLSNSALSNACASSTSQILSSILSQGANPNARDSVDGNVPIISAVKAGKPEYIKILLNAGADQTIEDGQGNNAAYYACTSYADPGDINGNNLQVVQQLVDDYKTKHNADLPLVQDSTGRNAFHYMAFSGVKPTFLDYVMDFISTTTNNPLNVINNEGKTPFYVTIEYNPSLLIPFLQHNADVNCVVSATGMRPILLATWNGNPDNVALFLGQNPDCPLTTPANATVIENEEGATALHYVARNPQYRDVNDLINMINNLVLAGADKDAKLTGGSSESNTPLHEAALYNQFKVAENLVQQHSASDLLNNNGQHFWELAPSGQQSTYHDLVSGN